MGKKEGWLCPHCPQRSHRHWNIQTHIKRKHDAIGQPVKAGSSTFNNNTSSGQFVSETMDYVKKDNYQNTPSWNPNVGYYNNKPSSFSRLPQKEEESQNTDPIDNMLPLIRKCNEFLREYVEFRDLSRRLPSNPSQSPVMMANIPISSSLPSSLSNLNNIQTNNNMINNNRLPIGYQVRFCNKCLPGNRLEPIFASSLEMEALTKVNHICEAESLASSIQQEHLKNSSTNIINEAQAYLVSYLIRVINLRIGQQEGGEEVDVHLKAQELNSPKLLLQHMGNKKLPENRSWIEEEDCIDLGNISHSKNVEKEKNWADRVIKEEGAIKMIKINKSELTDFVNNAKATFGVFQVQLKDGGKHYFLISIKF
jgi:hypothetical protein